MTCMTAHQRAKLSARISSRAFASLGMKEHENGFGRLRVSSASSKALEKDGTTYLITETPVNV